MSSSIAPATLTPSVPSKNTGGSAAPGNGSGFSGLLDRPRGHQATSSSSAPSPAPQKAGQRHHSAHSSESDAEETVSASALPPHDDGTHWTAHLPEENPSATPDESGKAPADSGKRPNDQNHPKDKPSPIGISAVLFGLSLPAAAGTPRNGGDPSAASAAPDSSGKAGPDVGGTAIQANARSTASVLPDTGQIRVSANASPPSLPARPGGTPRFSQIADALSSTSGATTDGDASAAQPSSSAKIAGVTVTTPTGAPPSGSQTAALQSAATTPDKATNPSIGALDSGADNAAVGTENTAARVTSARSASPSTGDRGNTGSQGQDGGDNSSKPASTTVHAGASQTQATASTAFGGVGGGGTLLGPTASSFVSGMESTQPWVTYMTQVAAMANGPAMAMPVRCLSIALQPAELGSVTANLHLSGQQLRIEVEVGSEEARQRLSSDADDIIKSLRSLGFDVSHITIKHGGNSVPAAAAANQAAQGQGNAQFQASTNSGGSSGGNAAGSNMGNNNGDNAHAPTPQPVGGDGGSRGLYI
jgi:chemotaxis protein MotD